MATIQQVEQMLRQKNLSGLCRALRDSNVLIRRRAAQALGELGDEAAVSHLARSVNKDTDTYVLQWSINSLAQIGTQAAIAALITAAFGGQLHVSGWASQALALVQTPEGQAALKVRDLIHRNDFASLEALGSEASAALEIILSSKQFLTWPSGRRKQVLNAAVKAGVQPPARFSHDLVEMGVFVSGVHSVGDLLNGLGHQNPSVQASAADRLGKSKISWTRPFIKNQFSQTSRPGGNRQAAVAMARALAELGDLSGIKTFRQQLYDANVSAAADAARALAEIGNSEALQVLFEFAVNPPQPPAYHNTPRVIAALETLGPEVVEKLRPYTDESTPSSRLLLAQLAARTGHPDTLPLLTELMLNPDREICHQAVLTLAVLNTPETSDAIFKLAEQLPNQWVVDALSSMTNAGSISHIRWLVPTAVAIRGLLRDDDGKPASQVYVQIIQEQYDEKKTVWEWQPISARAVTNDSGEFYLSVLSFGERPLPRIKITLPARLQRRNRETYATDIVLTAGVEIELKARIDRFVARLVVDTRLREPWSDAG